MFTVDGDGLVTAVGVGEAMITVTDRARSSVFGVSPVQVRAVPEDTGIELSSPSLSLMPGGVVVVNALLAPSLRARAVTWSLTPSTLATLTPNEGTSSASLSASARSGRGTLSATVTNESGVAVTASIEVEVEADVSGDFVIEEDGTLTGYRGTDATVVIPEGVTAIASHALSGTGVTSLRVPSSVRSIGDEAFSGSSLESLTFDGLGAGALPAHTDRQPRLRQHGHHGPVSAALARQGRAGRLRRDAPPDLASPGAQRRRGAAGGRLRGDARTHPH